jgi:hypothetical protein
MLRFSSLFMEFRGYRARDKGLLGGVQLKIIYRVAAMLPCDCGLHHVGTIYCDIPYQTPYRAI